MALYLQEFLPLFEKSKLLKKRYIKICNEYIAGTDEEFSTLSIIYNTEPMNLENPIYFDKNIMVAILKNNEFDRVEGNQLKNFVGNEVLWIGYSPISLHLNGIIDRLNNMIINKIPVYKIENITEDDNFRSIITSKASDGAASYIKNDFIMTMYGGMFPINKNDIASMAVYQNPDYTFLTEVIVEKKKPKDTRIYCYVKYRYLDI